MRAKKIIAATLTLTLVFGAVGNILPGGAIFDADIVASALVTGECGDNVSCSFEPGSGTLIIAGTGEMESMEFCNYWGEFGGIEGIDKDAIKKVIIDDGVTSIGDFAFSSCHNIASVEIPDTVTVINDYAFYNCNALDSVEISGHISKMGQNIFDNTKWLTDRKAEEDLVIFNDWVVDGKSCKDIVIIPEGVVGIASQAFSHTSYVHSIVVPASCKKISYLSFFCMDNLDYVSILDPNCIIEETNYRKTISNGSGKEFNGTLCGFSGSTAETYSKDYCNFSTITEASYVTAEFDCNDKGYGARNIAVGKGAKITMPKPTPNEELIFDCWKANGKSFKANDTVMISEDTTFVAQWIDSRKALEELNITTAQPVEGGSTDDALAETDNSNIKLFCVYWVTKHALEGDYTDQEIKNDHIHWELADPKEGEKIGSKFEKGRTYSAEFRIQGNGNYKITEDTKVFVNGVEAYIYDMEYSNTFACKALFTIPDPDASSSEPDSSGSDSSIPDSSKTDSSVPDSSKTDSSIPDSSLPDSSKPDSSLPDKSGFILGDVNGDGNIDIEDAVMVINHVNGNKALTDEESERANVDKNSSLDIVDAVAIISHVNGISVIS